ncbi:MAG: hypothetical protein IKH27_00995 [Oscillospiraceae bacterium]|nr:hypothetical protein [Oscillospiraceae bacterium]
MDILYNYDVYDTLTKLSALNLLPYNQNKAIIFDYVIDLILHEKKEQFQSNRKISRHRLEQIIGLSYQVNRHAIDPAEMPFVQRIQFYGNNWIMCGINTDCGYNLQTLINSIFLRDNNLSSDFKDTVSRFLEAILRISNSIATNLGFSMQSLGHFEKQRVDVPDGNTLKKMTDAISFSIDELNGIIEELEIEYLFSDFNTVNPALENYEYDFCFHPFLMISSKEFICLNPTVFATFAIHRILELSQDYNMYSELLIGFNNESWAQCKSYLKPLGHLCINEQSIGIELQNTVSYKEKLLSLSNGILVLFFLSSTYPTEPDEIDSYLPMDLKTRFQEIEAQLPVEVNRDRVYVLTVISRLSGTIIHGFSDVPPKMLTLRPFELQCISINEDSLFLPRYIDAEEKMHFHKMPTIEDALDKISYFTSADYSFYTADDVDLRGSVSIIGVGDAVDYINKALLKEDRQLIESPDSQYYTEVVSQDAKRALYCPTAFNDRIMLLLHLHNIDIWISSDLYTKSDELSVYYSLVDLISYWLGEVRCILEKHIFPFSSIVIINKLTDDIEKYYHEQELSSPLQELLNLKMDKNVVQLLWTPEAYYSVCQSGNEKKLIEVILDNLFSNLSADRSDYHLESFFDSPLKQRMQILESDTYPYLKPINEKPRFVLSLYENQILDEIGLHFHSMGLPYGEITSIKKDAVCNKIVSFLYKKFTGIISNYSSFSLCKKAYYDLEIIMFQMMQSQKRFAYDIACYPEKRAEIESSFNELNKSSIAIKFLIEYASSVQKSGEKYVDELDYDYLIALCSQIVNWANTGDLFHNNIIDEKITLLQSNRIGINKAAINRLTHYNYQAYKTRLNQSSDPSKLGYYNPWDELVDSDAINEAFVEEYGYSFSDLASLIMSMVVLGNEYEEEIKQASLEDIVQKIRSLSSETINRIIDDFSNIAREDFLNPPSPFTGNDVYPWRFNRRLSFIRRPILKFENELIWGNRQLFHNFLFLTDLIKEGKLATKKGKLQKLIGKIANKSGNDFNDAVVNKIRSLGYSMVFSKVEKINRKKIEFTHGETLGDIDVLFINPKKKKIVVIEAKEFSFSKTAYEMYREYLKLFCDSDKGPCYITKHKKRVAWVKDHITELVEQYHLNHGKWLVSDALVVNQPIVCNDFYHCQQKIVLFSELSTEVLDKL